TPKPEETTEVTEVTEVTETIETTEDVPSTTEVTVETTETTETREEIDDSSAVATTTTTSMSTSDESLISLSTEEEKGDDGAAGATVKTEVFRTVGANGSVITKTVRTIIRKVTTSTGLAKRLIEIHTTTVTETTTGETSSTEQTETREEIDDSSAVATTTTTSMSTSDESLISLSTEEEKGDDGAAGATVKTEVFRTVGANGSVITKTVRTIIRKVTTSTGLAKRLIEIHTTTVTETTTGETSSTEQTKTREEEESCGTSVGVIDVVAVVGTDGAKRSVGKSDISSLETKMSYGTKSMSSMSERTGKGSAWWHMKRRRLVKTWLPQFVSYVQRRGRSLSKSMPRKELLNFARDFCDQNFVSFEDGFFNSGSYEEKRATWTIARSLSFHYPGVAVQQLGLGVGKFQRTLLIDEVCHARDGPDGNPVMEVEFVLSALQVVPKKCAYYEDVLILENGEVLFHGTGESLISYFQELGFMCTSGVSVSDYLLNLNEEQEMYHQVTMVQGFNNQRQLRRSRMFSGLMKFADDMVLVTGAPGAGGPSRSSTPVGSPMRSSSTARLSTSYSPLRRQLKHRFVQSSPTKSPFRSPTAGFASPQSTNATRGMRITAYSSPESMKTASSMSTGYDSPTVVKGSTTTSRSSPVTTKTMSYSSPVIKTKGSTTARHISVEGDYTVITEEVTSPRGTKRVTTTRHATKESPSTTTA
ncbi:hypothetical protein BBP00_00008477, partial [Phytophthora kernoviae]